MHGLSDELTPIIALTAHVAGADAWRNVGMDAVLHKPFSVKKLAECIGTFLEPSEGEADQLVEISESREYPPEAQEEGALLNPETIERLVQTAQSGRRDSSIAFSPFTRLTRRACLRISLRRPSVARTSASPLPPTV